MKQRTSADKPDCKAVIVDNYGNNQNVFEIQDKETFFSSLWMKKSFLSWQQTDHNLVWDFFFFFYGYDGTKISYSEDDEINEGRGAIIRMQSIIN